MANPRQNPSQPRRDSQRANQNQRQIVASAALISAFLITSMTGEMRAEDSKPNFVLIVIDDLGWADLGCYGSKFHKTPNIDRLAKDGVRFTQAYAAAPIGAPTRAAILTGRYPQRMNITGSWANDAAEIRRRLLPPQVSRQLPLAEITLAEILKSAGYFTGCIGKWHLGGHGFGPTEQGFDVEIASNATGENPHEFAPYADPQGNILRGLEQAPEGEFLTERLAEEAQKFIIANQSKPFFLYLPHFAVHMPSEVKSEILAKYGAMPSEPNGKQINPRYAAFIESMDDAVGRVLTTLEDLKLSQHTIVMVTSDNGGVCNGNGQMIPPTSNAPLRDGMGHLYDGGLRVPFIVKWPQVAKAGTVIEVVVSCLDIFPSIAQAGSHSEDTASLNQLDGTSLIPILKGESAPRRDAIYWHYPHYNMNAGSKPGAAIRAGDWKLIEFYETGRQELFHVGQEISESNNVILEFPEIAKELAQKLQTWRESVNARRPTTNPHYLPNPQNQDGTVTLHSSTADISGLMLRYEPLPNKDTIGYWIREDDWAQFEFTLEQPGHYEIIPHVGCGTEGGSVVEFEVAKQVLPLLVPATGHFQNFVPQVIGSVHLEKPGRYVLTVRPEKKRGAAVMDLRTIVLKPLNSQ